MNLFKMKKSMLWCSIGSFIATTLFLLGISKDSMIILTIILLIGNIVLSIVHCKTENATELINAALVSRLSVVMFNNAIFNVYSIIYMLIGSVMMLQGDIFTAIFSYLGIVVKKICVDILGSPYIISYFVATHKAGIRSKKIWVHILLQLIPCVNIMDTFYLKMKNNNWSNKKKKIFSIIAGLLIYSILFVFSLMLLSVQY